MRGRGFPGMTTVLADLQRSVGATGTTPPRHLTSRRRPEAWLSGQSARTSSRGEPALLILILSGIHP